MKAMLRILLLGNNGQLGWELQRTLAPLGEVTALDFPQLDLSQPQSAHAVIKAVHPQVIVNATAYTDVDRAEQEAEQAYALNRDAPAFLAKKAREVNAALIHYSTDYVFNGSKGSPYDEDDATDPINVYGLSKVAGEQAIQAIGGAYVIIRTSWLYSLRRDSFVTHVLQWARQQSSLRIVDDQVGNPTWARMLAEISASLLARGNEKIADWLGERRGIYHLAGSGAATRMEWAQAILQYDPKAGEQITREILPAKTTQFRTPADRPLFSALNCDKFSSTFNLSLPHWKEALQMALQ
jgi:dTDP-4-dehydrorhamnose reductase